MSPQLSWIGTAAADLYGIYISQYPYGSSNLVYTNEAISGSATSFTVPAGYLVNGGQYRWNMAAHNGAGWGGVSDRLYFAVSIPETVLVSPINGATGVSLTPMLSWNAANGPTSYDVYLGTSSSPPFVANSAGTSYTPNMLSTGTTYYWRVVAKNSAGSTTSPTWWFTTQGIFLPPGTPTNVSPANGVTGVSTTPTLIWTGGIGASSHDVYFGTSTSPPFVSNTMTTSYNPGNLNSNTTYYWRLVAKNGAGSTTSPIWFFTTTSGSSGVVTLATGLSNPNSVAVDAASVYWTDYRSGTVRAVSKSGGPVTILVSGLYSPTGIAADNSYVYFGEDYGTGASRVHRVPKGGGSITTLTTGISSISRIAINSANVFWTDIYGGTIGRVSLSGGSAATISSGATSPAGIAIDGANVYWSEFSNPGGIRKAPLTGGAFTTLSADSNSLGVATDGINVYWTENVSTNNGKVRRASVDGGAAITLANGLNSPWDLQLDTTSVFWIENRSNGAVRQISITGGSPVDLATSLSEPVAIAQDGTYVYWIERNGGGAGSGTLKKVAKALLPGVPSSPSPSNGATGALLTPNLVWTGGIGATSYDLYFGTASDPPFVTNTTGTSYSPSSLSGGTTYYWRVLAKNSAGSASSATWSFTTQVVVLPPGTPSNPSPVNGAAGVSTTPTFSWTGGSAATSHDVYLGASPNPPFVANTFGTSYNPGILSGGTTFYWRVVAKNSAGPSTSSTWSFTTAGSGGSSGLRFVPVTPCRIMDTRSAAGPFGGPSIAGGSTRNVAIPSSGCGIPTSAAAYSLNVTVVPSGGLSYLTLWPTGQSQPGVSTLNSFDGRIKANAAVVPAGSSGQVSVFVTQTTDVLLDINGYFVPASGSSNLAFYPVAPCRVTDTRSAAGPFGGPSMTAGQTRSFTIPSAGCGIPTSAQAYALNMTVVPPGPLSFLTTWPAGQAQPVVSTLNAFTGAVTANAAIVPAGSSGAVSVYVTHQTDLLIDINGYFAPPGSLGELAFYPVNPCRISDTRNAAGPFGGPAMAAGQTRSYPVTSSGCGLPPTAKAYSLNATVVPSGPLAFLTLWPTGQSQPSVSTLNAFDGSVVSNAAIVPAGTSGSVTAFVTNLTDLILDVNGYFAP